MSEEKNVSVSSGVILEGVGGRYTVLTDDGERAFCKARGAFRHAELSPLPGDRVTFRSLPDGSCGLERIEERKNFLIRPPLSNLGALFITIAAATPEPYLPLADKLTVICEKNGILPVIVVTKASLAPGIAEEIRKTYASCGFRVFVTDSLDKSYEESGIGPLRDYFLGGEVSELISAFCGVSGAGKSTLINTLFPALRLEVGELSERIERGKNTTRTSTLFPLCELIGSGAGSGFLADTPGFSLLDFTRFFFCGFEELPELFREFRPHLTSCRYTSCTHTVDEGCAVLAAVERGEIPKSRHESFLLIREELAERKNAEYK